jgi:hypothetical protein
MWSQAGVNASRIAEAEQKLDEIGFVPDEEDSDESEGEEFEMDDAP